MSYFPIGVPDICCEVEPEDWVSDDRQNKEAPDDPIHPSYYKKGIEVIDIIETYELGFHLGNVVKYVLSHKNKNKNNKGLEDLEKAQYYLNRYIEKLKENTNEE